MYMSVKVICKCLGTSKICKEAKWNKLSREWRRKWGSEKNDPSMDAVFNRHFHFSVSAYMICSSLTGGLCRKMYANEHRVYILLPTIMVTTCCIIHVTWYAWYILVIILAWIRCNKPTVWINLQTHFYLITSFSVSNLIREIKKPCPNWIFLHVNIIPLTFICKSSLDKSKLYK